MLIAGESLSQQQNSSNSVVELQVKRKDDGRIGTASARLATS